MFAPSMSQASGPDRILFVAMIRYSMTSPLWTVRGVRAKARSSALELHSSSPPAATRSKRPVKTIGKSSGSTVWRRSIRLTRTR